AASEPARPAPTICTDPELAWLPVMVTQVARFRAQWNAAGAGLIGRYDNARGEAGVIRLSV
ncbi:MAG TPA: hypothetical protein VFI51_03415, partial [Bradyrhizobium sp.]|nr:hypothetical protein [Bradyrhizobium sp.]